MRGCEDYRKLTYPTDPNDVWGRSHYVGNAELAVRLGSPDAFDRRGTTLLYDDFDAPPLRWDSWIGGGGGGVGGVVARDTTNPYRGEGCVKLTCPNAANDQALAYRSIGISAEGRMSIEAAIKTATTGMGRVVLEMDIVTENNELFGAVCLPTISVAGLAFRNDAAVGITNPAKWTTIDSTYNVFSGTYYNLKLVIDIEKEEYVRCIFAGHEYDISGNPLDPSAVAGYRTVSPRLYIIADAAANRTAYFDDVILKIQEPEN